MLAIAAPAVTSSSVFRTTTPLTIVNTRASVLCMRSPPPRGADRLLMCENGTRDRHHDRKILSSVYELRISGSDLRFDSQVFQSWCRESSRERSRSPSGLGHTSIFRPLCRDALHLDRSICKCSDICRVVAIGHVSDEVRLGGQIGGDSDRRLRRPIRMANHGNLGFTGRSHLLRAAPTLRAGAALCTWHPRDRLRE